MTQIERPQTTPQPCHTTLDTEIAEWRKWWGELAEIGKPNFGEMGSRLAQFRNHLAEHFAAEETGAFLTIIVDAEPAIVDEIARLQDEHQIFLADLDDLVERLQSGQPEIDCWGQARTEFEDFLDRLNSHEDAEEQLNLPMR